MQVKFTLLTILVQIVNIQIYNVHCSSNDSIQRRDEDIIDNNHLKLSTNRFFFNSGKVVSSNEEIKLIKPLSPNLNKPKKSLKQVSAIASSKFYNKYSKNMNKLAHNGAKLVKVTINSFWDSAISVYNIMQATLNFAVKKMIMFFDHPSQIMSLPYDAFHITKANVKFPFQFIKYLVKF